MRRSWASRLEQLDDLALHIRPRCSPHQKIGHRAIVRGQQDGSVLSVAVENPPGEKEGRALVALAERLGASYPIGDDSGGRHRVIDVVDRPERPLEPLKIVRLVEPLVVGAHGAVDRYCQRQGWADQ